MNGEKSEDGTYLQEAKRDSISQDLTTDDHGLKHRLHASTSWLARGGSLSIRISTSETGLLVMRCTIGAEGLRQNYAVRFNP